MKFLISKPLEELMAVGLHPKLLLTMKQSLKRSLAKHYCDRNGQNRCRIKSKLLHSCVFNQSVSLVNSMIGYVVTPALFLVN